MVIVAVSEFVSLGHQCLHHVDWRIDADGWWTTHNHVDNHPCTQQEVHAITQEEAVHEDVIADYADCESKSDEIGCLLFNKSQVVLVVWPFSEEKEYAIEETLADDQVDST